MKKLFLVLLSALLGFLVGIKYYHRVPGYPKVTRASAVIYPTKGNTAAGTVFFTQEQLGVRVNVNIKGLTPGDHGFHIHEFGNCTCDDAVCAGDHYNPTNQPHADRTATKRHVGDLGNITAQADGSAQTEFIDPGITLNGPHSIIGRAVIVHEKPDDLSSQPSGNAGGRIGCGVVGIAKAN